MQTRFLLSLTFLILGIVLIACGGSSSRPVVQTSTVAFLQETQNRDGLFFPMLGTFSASASNVQFTVKLAAIDPGTGQNVSAALGSIFLSASGKKATFDLYGGTIDAPSTRWDIWVANSDGSGLVQVTNDTYEDAMPQLSPDGAKVIYMSCRPVAGGTTQCDGGPGQWQVVVRNVDGSGEQVLPLPPGLIYAGEPTYSPDGSKLAMAAAGVTGETGFEGVYLVNSDGSNPHLLTNPCSTTYSCIDEFSTLRRPAARRFRLPI